MDLASEDWNDASKSENLKNQNAKLPNSIHELYGHRTRARAPVGIELVTEMTYATAYNQPISP